MMNVLICYEGSRVEHKFCKLKKRKEKITRKPARDRRYNCKLTGEEPHKRIWCL